MQYPILCKCISISMQIRVKGSKDLQLVMPPKCPCQKSNVHHQETPDGASTSLAESLWLGPKHWLLGGSKTDRWSSPWVHPKQMFKAAALTARELAGNAGGSLTSGLLWADGTQLPWCITAGPPAWCCASPWASSPTIWGLRGTSSLVAIVRNPADLGSDF